MPTYEYRCPDGHEFELFQRMSDPPAADCPECGKAATRLLSSGGGLLFKGSGFYITDYRSDSYRKMAESESKAGNGAADSSPASGKAGAGDDAAPASTPASSSSGGSTGDGTSSTSASEAGGKAKGKGKEKGGSAPAGSATGTG